MCKIISLVTIFIGVSLWGQENLISNEGVLQVDPETMLSIEGNFINRESGDYKNDGEVRLKADFENWGVAGYNQKGGLTRFEGNDIQEISGDAPAIYFDVLFDNSSRPVPLHLSGVMSIDGGVSFHEGIIDNEHFPGLFEMNEEAYHFNTSDKSHVMGPVHRLGNDEFVYPVGKNGYYRPAILTSITNPEAYFEGEFFLENSDGPERPHSLTSEEILRIDNQQYWIIDEISEEVPERMLLSLTYSDKSTPEFIMDAVEKENITIVRWDEDAQMWIDQGGTVDFENEMVTTQVDGLGVFTFAIVDGEELFACKVTVYNAVTPDGDGINDYFRIEGDGDCAYPFRVKIFNRWGVKVFESANYGLGGDVFDGYSQGRATINSDERLPAGTYFYILEYDYDVSSGGQRTERKAGYLYLSSNRAN